MADTDESGRADKIAAARKRFEQQLKKKKKGIVKKEDKPDIETEDIKNEDAGESQAESLSVSKTEGKDEEGAENKIMEEIVSELTTDSQRTPSSLSFQSKLRSSSFRQSVSAGPISPSHAFSPDRDTAPDIHRRQAIRIDELEKENKRLVKEVADGERRWRKAEEELEDMREADEDVISSKAGPSSSGEPGELTKLRSEVMALQRQNTQLQAHVSRSTRHGSSPSVSALGNLPVDYEAALASKSSTIESMEFEISSLRAAIDRMTSGSPENEQILALEEKLSRTEKVAAIAQRELQDLKKNLERTAEKAVKEGSERISAETKLRTLEQELEEAQTHRLELEQKVDVLERKASTLATLHKEHDARFRVLKRERDASEKETSELRARLASMENANLRLREEHERTRKEHADGTDDDGVDELENEERARLEKKIRDLEGELYNLRRGVWRDRRKELDGDSVLSPTKFTNVDLRGRSPSRRKSEAAQAAKGGLGEFITNGLNAITGGNALLGADDALLDDEELIDFDENAFRLAQEEEAERRIERIKDIKRALKDWEGWRLDLVEARKMGGEGFGIIFDV